MIAADFKGLYFYKLIIPAFTWGSILGTFLGPFFFPAAWFLFVAAFMVVFVLVSLSQVNNPLSALLLPLCCLAILSCEQPPCCVLDLHARAPSGWMMHSFRLLLLRHINRFISLK